MGLLKSREYKERRREEAGKDQKPATGTVGGRVSAALNLLLGSLCPGRYGLFGQNEHLGNWWYWDEAERLKEIAREIIDIKSEYGEQATECERLLYYCSLRGPHVVGEPKLAEQFLNEIQPPQQREFL
jgi:hypothetical protein